MRALSRLPFVVFAPIAVAMAAACGGGGSSSLSGPSSSDPVAAVAGNAVLQGAIDAGASTSSGVHAATTPHAGMKVTVVGSSISATVDTYGQFILTGLPSGTVTLRFEGQGVDATVEVAGLKDGLVLTVTLAVQGPRVQVLSAPPAKPSCEFTFDGVIESVSGTRLVVSGRQVDVKDTQKVWRGQCRVGVDNLKVGDKVTVAGQLQGSGLIAAYEISAHEPKAAGKAWSPEGDVGSFAAGNAPGDKVDCR